jgi:murein DD-endopeptidase MepM/ murein hydrolase activator NlpD
MHPFGIFRAALILGCGALAACADRPTPVAPATAPAAPAASQIYVIVERGQSLDRIAQAYRVAKQDIIAANNLKPPYALRPGTVLHMPLTAVQPAKQTPEPKPTPANGTVAEPDRSAGTAAPAPRGRPKSPPPEVIPLD